MFKVVRPFICLLFLANVCQASLRDLANKNHFYFGAGGIKAVDLSDSREASLLTTEFNFLTPGEYMKWGFIHPQPGPQGWNWGPADALLHFAQAHNLQVKGHCLLWHDQNPSYVNEGNFTWQDMVDEIWTEVSRYRDWKTADGRKLVIAWDVVNEAVDTDSRGSVELRPNVFLRKFGSIYIVKAFQVAHAADPQAILLYNDYGDENMNSKSDFIFGMLNSLKAHGVPVNGVGLQMHVTTWNFPDPHSVAANMQRFRDAGFLIHISEMDVQVNDPHETGESLADKFQKQAKLYGDILFQCLSNRTSNAGCFALSTWGISDQYSWIRKYPSNPWGSYDPKHEMPLIFSDSYLPKPAYQTVFSVLGQQEPN